MSKGIFRIRCGSAGKSEGIPGTVGTAESEVGAMKEYIKGNSSACRQILLTESIAEDYVAHGCCPDRVIMAIIQTASKTDQ